MKRTFSNLGGLQSMFFCAGIYVVSLFFSIFICSAVFYAFNPKKATTAQNTSVVTTASTPVMLASTAK